MGAATHIAIGAPGIYRHPRTTEQRLGGVRMDVCAFVGVAPRGPARVPREPDAWCGDRALVGPSIARRRSVAVPVESWDDYKRLYGAFEGPGRLPYAVASFFEQGGRKAYIVRIVHDYCLESVDIDTCDELLIEQNLAGVAEGILAGVVIVGAASDEKQPKLVARNEGQWGNSIQAALGFSVTPVELIPDANTSRIIHVSVEEPVTAGSLLRLDVPVMGLTRHELRFVSNVQRLGEASSGNDVLSLELDFAVTHPPKRVELIDGDLLIVDGAGTSERFKGLGFSSRHPRWMATILYNNSELVYPHHAWIEREIIPKDVNNLPIDVGLKLLEKSHFGGGEDRYAEIKHADFFDSNWTLGDPEPGDGIHALTLLDDLSSVVVPDLYVPEHLAAPEAVHDLRSLAGPNFAPCVKVQELVGSTIVKEHNLDGLLLDPDIPEELETITQLQQEIVALAQLLGRFIVLLDVPPGLTQKQILRWRSHFRSSFAAAYHPWLIISNTEDRRNVLIRINPAATAAGIIAKQEIAFGVPHGPANVIAASVVKVDERISPTWHDELHPQGINVFLQERDGIRLSAGRTLSRDSRYRQLSVRRLMEMLRRALEQQMQWLVFEPNGPSLWSDVRHMLDNYLRRLYTAGAFKGETEEDAYFVHCDADINTQQIIDAGKLIAEIGVAPAEPLEFLVVRITRGGDGTLSVEA